METYFMTDIRHGRRAAKTGITFAVSAADADLIRKIVERAARLFRDLTGSDLDRLSLSMDLTACHANGNPLRLADLYRADDFNFGHDVFGIGRHLDRDTGKLSNHFLPRFSA